MRIATVRAVRASESRVPNASERPRAKALPLRKPTLADLPREGVPGHVRHCHALGASTWWIWLWEKAHPEASKTRVPFNCGSWRCPVCRKHEAHVAWTRMRDAFAPLDARGACLFVLTLDRYGTYSGEKRWKDSRAAYQDLGRLSNEFLKRLRKWMKSQGWEPLRNQWVATVEAHRKGWPHVNFVIWSPELADWLESEKHAKMQDGMSERETPYVSGPLADIVTGAGWGLISTAERSRSRDETLGYIIKVAGKVDESIGELAKLSQLPTNAPFRFRRLRSGKGFLPPRKKSEFMTGTLIRRQNSNDGTRDAVPLHDIKDPVAIAQSEQACALEERIWYDELEAEHRCARQFARYGRSAIALPPVTRWFNGRRLERGPPEKNHERTNRYGPSQRTANEHQPDPGIPEPRDLVSESAA